MRLRAALAVICLSSPSLVHGQAFAVEMATVPAADVQPGGPDYDYDVARFEVTNLEYATFLNDAELRNELQNPGFGDERGEYLLFRAPPFGGDVGLVVGDLSDVDAVFDISRSLLTHDETASVGGRYSVVPGKENHPVVGVSWIGAVKFCNWLTIDHGLGLDARCYAEGDSEFDWFPRTIGTEIGGTQQATNLARDLNAAERLALVTGCEGYRLLMDQGGTAVGHVNAVARPFNEWYKAASHDVLAPDVSRTAFAGFFEEHEVTADHWVHAYGRDALFDADANYRDSGDPFDDPNPAVIATTPVGYYDGSDHGGAFQTTASANRYGLHDLSGNAWELLNDQVTITDGPTPDRALVGGSYRSNQRQVASANRGDIGPGTTRPVVGFRVMRVPSPPCVPPAGTPVLTIRRDGREMLLDWTLLSDSVSYDAVRGDLDALHATRGDLTAATTACIADDLPATSTTFNVDPASVDGLWFLVRGADCGGGPHDTAVAAQLESRDAELAAAPTACP